MMPSRFIATHLSKVFIIVHLRYRPVIQVLNLTVRWRCRFVLSTVDGVHLQFGRICLTSVSLLNEPVDNDFKENYIF